MIEIKDKNGEVKYLYNGETLVGADLRYANLSCAYLSCAILNGANLHCADLTCANLRGANLKYVDLYCADLRFTDLRRADLRGADLTCAYLYGTDFTDAIIDETTKGLNDQCPKNGSFIGYKKCYDYERIKYIVKLEIPTDARRSSSTGNKCRCDKAKVLSITRLNGRKTDLRVVHSLYDYGFVYKVGEIVEEPNFDDRYWIECGKGIHFFMNRKDAVDF